LLPLRLLGVTATQQAIPTSSDILAGAIIGIVVAATVCGLISVLTLIEKHLRFIAESAEYQNALAKIKIDQRDRLPPCSCPAAYCQR